MSTWTAKSPILKEKMVPEIKLTQNNFVFIILRRQAANVVVARQKSWGISTPRLIELIRLSLGIFVKSGFRNGRHWRDNCSFLPIPLQKIILILWQNIVSPQAPRRSIDSKLQPRLKKLVELYYRTDNKIINRKKCSKTFFELVFEE